MDKNEKSVRDFFDSHAPEYKSKYTDKGVFYEYFFFERLDKATSSIDFSKKRILDIGAGTGPLYDYLVDNSLDDFESYDATDLSGGMLSQSAINKENQHVGDFLDLSFNREKFDIVFMLGVSTYLSPENMQRHIDKIQEVLAPNGQFIVSFTHKKSLDIRLRGLFTPLAKLFANKNRIIAQDFDTWFYGVNETKKMFDVGYTIQSIQGLNHTIFPFSRIVPKLSIFLAKKIAHKKDHRLKLWLSSDLLFKVKKSS